MIKFEDFKERFVKIYTEDVFNRYNGDYYLATPVEDEGYISFCFNYDKEGCFLNSGDSEWSHPYYVTDLLVERAAKAFNISFDEKRGYYIPIEALDEKYICDCVCRFGTFETITSGEAILKGFIIDYGCESGKSEYSKSKYKLEQFVEVLKEADKHWKMFESFEMQENKCICKTRFYDLNCKTICVDLTFDEKKGVIVSYKVSNDEFTKTKTFEKLTTFFMDYFEESNCVGKVFTYPESMALIKDVLFGIVMTANGGLLLDIPFEEYKPDDESLF